MTFGDTRLPPRFWQRVTVLESGCWRWCGGGLGDGGYAMVRLGGPKQAVHRLFYTHLVGPIPDGLTLDHLCHDAHCDLGDRCPHRRCVNPDHLRPATMRDNVLRGNGLCAKKAVQTTCLRGHAFTAANTCILIRKRGGQMRRCKQCAQVRDRASYERRKLKSLAASTAKRSNR
jgi:hypothetical protein